MPIKHAKRQQAFIYRALESQWSRFVLKSQSASRFNQSDSCCTTRTAGASTIVTHTLQHYLPTSLHGIADCRCVIWGTSSRWSSQISQHRRHWNLQSVSSHHCNGRGGNQLSTVRAMSPLTLVSRWCVEKIRAKLRRLLVSINTRVSDKPQGPVQIIASSMEKYLSPPLPPTPSWQSWVSLSSQNIAFYVNSFTP